MSAKNLGSTHVAFGFRTGLVSSADDRVELLANLPGDRPGPTGTNRSQPSPYSAVLCHLACPSKGRQRLFQEELFKHASKLIRARIGSSSLSSNLLCDNAAAIGTFKDEFDAACGYAVKDLVEPFLVIPHLPPRLL
jgi:hypothetical protein